MSIGHLEGVVGHTGPVVSQRREHVTILLSIYDGEPWLDALLGSVRAQSHANWTLLVRDDGSTDASADIVARHGAADPRVVLLADDGRGNLGPAASFMELLTHVDDGCFAFCDQDDVWLPHKLAWSLEVFRAAPPMSVVVTDAEVMTGDGRTIAASALAARGVDGPIDIGRLLINNAAIGATMLGGAELARAAVELGRGETPLMHDWWCALVAAYAGEVVVVAAPTIRWRRHPGTVTGATPSTLRGRLRRRLDYLEWSIGAAQRLRDGPVPPADGQRADAVEALARLNAVSPRFSGMLRAAAAGVRAWSWRAEAALLVAVAARSWRE